MAAATAAGAIAADLLDLDPEDFAPEIAAYVTGGSRTEDIAELARSTGDPEIREWARTAVAATETSDAPEASEAIAVISSGPASRGPGRGPGVGADDPRAHRGGRRAVAGGRGRGRRPAPRSGCTPRPGTRAHVLEIVRRLAEAYGPLPYARRHPPVNELVTTLLSHSTTDLNQERAFRELRARFPTWDEVRRAPVAEVEDAVRVAGLANQKAPRIQETLDRIADDPRGSDLEWLGAVPLDEAMAFLTVVHRGGAEDGRLRHVLLVRRPHRPGRHPRPPHRAAHGHRPQGVVGHRGAGAADALDARGTGLRDAHAPDRARAHGVPGAGPAMRRVRPARGSARRAAARTRATGP